MDPPQRYCFCFLLILMAFLVRRCQSAAASSSSTDEGTFLMPGTNFCGKGFRASRFDQLGAYGPADKCCREHDFGCPSSIAPMDTAHGLYNWRPYPTMHCSCDDRFRTCLKLANSRAADTVGQFFFNVIKTSCFEFAREEVCEERHWWGGCKKTEWREVAKWRAARPY